MTFSHVFSLLSNNVSVVVS